MPPRSAARPRGLRPAPCWGSWRNRCTPWRAGCRRTGLPGTPGGADAAEALRATAALVDSRASAEDAGAYKAMLLDVADRVARAAKEGGFLGIGGRQVSDSEAEALETIKAALQGGTPASGETAGMR